MTSFEKTLTEIEKTIEIDIEQPSAVDVLVNLMKDIIKYADDTVWLCGQTTVCDHIRDMAEEIGGLERFKIEFPDYY